MINKKSLRHKQTLRSFEYFLDKMLELLDKSPGHFVKVFPSCPVAYFDLIDDLRTCTVSPGTSEDLKRVASKAKKISYTFFKLDEILTRSSLESSTEDEEEEDEFIEDGLDFNLDYLQSN